MRNKRGIDLLAKERSRWLNHIQNQDAELAAKIKALKAPSWFRLKNSEEDSGETTADLYIYDEIVDQMTAEWWGGLSAQMLINELNELDASTINVRINSPGGAVFEAIAIYNALMSNPATINVYVDSLAASAASVIAMAGDSITMMVGSQMMIHDALGIEMGNAAQMREFADFLDKQSQNLAGIYAEKAGGEADDFRALMLAETWLYAEEAVELGLADKVYSRPSNEEKKESEEDGSESEETEETEEDSEETTENEESEEDTDDDEEMENLLNRRHKLVARGFKYAGRRRAPDPLQNEVDEILNALAGR